MHLSSTPRLFFSHRGRGPGTRLVCTVPTYVYVWCIGESSYVSIWPCPQAPLLPSKGLEMKLAVSLARCQYSVWLMK